MSFYNSILNFIWVLKPLFGFIADSYAICGSHRRAYLIIFSLVGSLSWLLLGFWVHTLAQALLIKTVVNVSSSFCNVVGEGIMVTASQKSSTNTKRRGSVLTDGCRESRKNEEEVVSYDSSKAATNVSIYLSLTSLSTIASSYLGGYLLNFYSDRQIFVMASLLPFMTLLAGLIAQDPQRVKSSTPR